MDDESASSIPPELRVSLDVEFTAKGLNSTVEHQKLQAALIDIPGVESISFSENKIALRYDPEQVTKAELTELIETAGYPISNSASAPPTPSLD